MKPIQFEEVQKAVFSMVGDKAPGPNGFPTFLYQTFWDIVGKDVWDMVEESRSKANVAKELNCTLLDLNPKVEHLTSFNEFRQISLCNTIYKVVAKVISNQLKPILNHIISEERSGFVLGISIVEGIIIAHEAIHTIRQAKVDRMLIKLDIRKVYDMVDREFLFQVLNKFGFSKEWINWVRACIGGVWTSALVNGSPQGTSGVGVVARDDNGSILFKGAQRLQDGMNNEAKAQAAFLATELALNMKVQ
ncbi:uncharacterized protein LOC131858304 [Cryptomeria japonica]|uniref:uncharacterized protein LOC131858304 n=1 Tax=Cryptomeria japonica TaxID=3369 RepID=UPI0027DA7989|nr:uncharacterized protein LOC131858304 [Cryptomeria japonica]